MENLMLTTKTTPSFAIVAATAGLMLVVTADTSFARGRGYPSCEASCQANKAKPPTTIANGKTVLGLGGGPNAGGRNYKQQ
jgi:hypothetical protein